MEAKLLLTAALRFTLYLEFVAECQSWLYDFLSGNYKIYK